jgi:hypothetical protein
MAWGSTPIETGGTEIISSLHPIPKTSANAVVKLHHSQFDDFPTSALLISDFQIGTI